jgi:hypothetical protein
MLLLYRLCCPLQSAASALPLHEQQNQAYKVARLHLSPAASLRSRKPRAPAKLCLHQTLLVSSFDVMMRCRPVLATILDAHVGADDGAAAALTPDFSGQDGGDAADRRRRRCAHR